MAVPRHNAVPLSGNPYVDGLVQGGAWIFNGAHRLTYSFHIDPPDSKVAGQWTVARMDALRDALASWSAVANLRFTEVYAPPEQAKSSADLAISLFSSPNNPQLAALAFFPDPNFINRLFAEVGMTRAQWPRPEGDVGINYTSGIMSYIGHGGFGYNVLIHELGHSLGLKQPFDDGGNHRPTFVELGIGELDSSYYTVMSYEVLNYASPYVGHVQTPMPLDILAIQHIYGPNRSHHTGNDVYRLVERTVSTIWDAGGHDAIDASGLREGMTLDLTPGAVSRFGALGAIGVAYNMTLEDASGSRFGDTLLGSRADNHLAGMGGADLLDGGNGSDELDGGNGNDELVGGAGNDVLIGGSGADIMRGGLGDDSYSVDRQNDTVDERVDEGNDTVLIEFANTGDASLLVSLSPAILPLVSGASSGVIGSLLGAPEIARVTAAAPANLLFHDVENLRVTGTGRFDLEGDERANRLFGNAAANVLYGLGGADWLDGGTGADHLLGGDGDDVYVVDSLLDVIVENSDGGIDTVRSAIAWSLAAQPELENLTLIGTAAVRATGNDGANQLIGNAGNNTLAGLAGDDWLDGGKGHDAMYGGLGDDTYVVDDAADRVSENAGAGHDTVRSAISLVLGSQLEGLVLLGGRALDGTGNTLANTVMGNAGVNILSGLGGGDRLEGGGGNDRLLGGAGDDLLFGGPGNDTLQGDAGNDVLDGGAGSDIMHGGLGDDCYYVSAKGDEVMELARAGVDTVFSAVSYTLGSQLENLTLIGARALSASGNERANEITGNQGANLLSGLAGADMLVGGAGDDTLDGGSGADRLFGGEGDDVLRFDSADSLRDGGSGHDLLRFDDGHVLLDLSGRSGVAYVGLDAIDLAGGNTLRLSSSDVLNTSDGNLLFVSGAIDSHVTVLDTGWTTGGDLDIDGIHYRGYALGAAQLYVDAELSLAIA